MKLMILWLVVAGWLQLEEAQPEPDQLFD